MYNRLRKQELNQRRQRFSSEQWRESCSKSFEKLDKSDVKHLFHAIKLGKIHLVKFILDATENKLQNSRDIDGRTPLIASCLIKEENTRDQLTKLLLDRHADVNLVDQNGRTALSHACERRCNDIVTMLIQIHNIDPDAPDKLGNTPLIYCAKEGNDVALEILVKCFRRLGLKVDHVNNEGFTALLEAARNANLSCAKILATQGRAHKSLRDKQTGRTATEWFQLKGYDKSDLAFLFGNSKFVRAVKLTSILKSKSFGGLPKPVVVTPRSRYNACLSDVQERRRLLKHRSKSLVPKVRDMGSSECIRRKARYHKQRSADSGNKQSLGCEITSSSDTAINSTLQQLGAMSLKGELPSPSVPDTLFREITAPINRALTSPALPIPSSPSTDSEDFLAIGSTDI